MTVKFDPNAEELILESKDSQDLFDLGRISARLNIPTHSCGDAKGNRYAKISVDSIIRYLSA